MTALSFAKVGEDFAQFNSSRENDFVSLRSLANLTGFPSEFIKEELLMEEEVLTLDELRQRMAVYLETLDL
ncbi:MAG: hypothetical protein H6622_16850 [Halobacteriovoraceae bacterium]|nr:hypothetical protein [Halobacteriovoraceae bacterium]